MAHLVVDGRQSPVFRAESGSGEGDHTAAGIPATYDATTGELVSSPLVGDASACGGLQQFGVVGVAMQIAQGHIDCRDFGFAPGACREGAGAKSIQGD